MMSQSEIRLLEMKLSKAERSNDKLYSALLRIRNGLATDRIPGMPALSIAEAHEIARAAIAAAKGGAT